MVLSAVGRSLNLFIRVLAWPWAFAFLFFLFFFLSFPRPVSSNRSTLSSIYLQEGPPHELFFCEMQLTLHATRPTPHGASRFLMCKQISICLDGEDPNALGPDIIGTRGGSVESVVIQLPSHECHEYTHPPRPLPCRSLKKRLESANPRYSLLATVRVML